MNVSDGNVTVVNISGVNVRGCECKWFEHNGCERNCDVNVSIMNVSDDNG